LPRLALALTVGALVLGAGCRKKTPDMLAIPPGASGPTPVPGSAQLGLKHLADQLGLSTADLPAWLERCQVHAMPVAPNASFDMNIVVCGAHGLIVTSGPGLPGQTDALLRAAFVDLIAQGPAARARKTLESRPARGGGELGVVVLTVDQGVIGQVAATELGPTLVAIGCSGPDVVPSRATFCDAALGLLPAPRPPANHDSRRQGPMQAPAQLPEPLSELAGQPLTGWDADAAWSGKTEHVSVHIEPLSTGDADSARALWQALDKQALLACVDRSADVVHRYGLLTERVLYAAPDVPVAVQSYEWGLPVVKACLDEQRTHEWPTDQLTAPTALGVRVWAKRLSL